MLFTWVLVLFGTSSKFDQSLFSTFLVGYFFLILFLYFPYTSFLNNWDAWVDFVKMFSVFSLILSITKMLQSWLIVHSDVRYPFLNSNLDFMSASSLRYVKLGFTRIPSASDFVFYATLFLLIFHLIHKRVFSGMTTYLILGINTLYIVFVGQTRSYIVLLLIVYIIAAFIRIKEKFDFSLILMIIITLSVPVILLILYVINRLLYGDANRVSSLSIRLEAVKYYISNLRFSGWFSMGFARDSVYGNLIHNQYVTNLGQVVTYNYDDVGIVGFLAQFGLVGIVDMVIYAVTLMVSFIKSRKKEISFLIIVVILGSCINLSLLDPQRIFYLPMVLVMLDFISSSKYSS
ncbi:hypothetical protein OM945_11875 [Levilactobacillus namurensis]|nr:hypothetical protein [Levilactobacillus namurensis]MDT7018146.1 hypothetical protein [Levilactobacillus namurensis]